MYRHRENEISEFIVAVEKIKLCEDFIRLVEIRFYCMYFSESASSSPSPLKYGQMCYISWSITTYLEAKIGKKLFLFLASREKKPQKRGRVNEYVQAGATKNHGN